MKHLNTFKLFESAKFIKDIISEVKDIFIDLKDDDWVIVVEYVPIRWSSGALRMVDPHKGDYIEVVLKKHQNKKGNLYTHDSIFKLGDAGEINRVMNLFNDRTIEISLCYPGESGNEYVRGMWRNAESIDSDIDLLGIDLKIYLDVENIDQFRFQDVRGY